MQSAKLPISLEIVYSLMRTIFYLQFLEKQVYFLTSRTNYIIELRIGHSVNADVIRICENSLHGVLLRVFS